MLPGPSSPGSICCGRVAGERRETPVIVVTGESDIPTTVRAMKAGAAEFLLKPLADDVLLGAIGHAQVTRKMRAESLAELVAVCLHGDLAGT